MPTEDWELVDELFAEALAVNAAQREGFLRGRCGADAILFDRVSRLLRDHGRAAPQFLERLPLLEGIRGLPPASGPDPLIGRTIGAYTIREAIARGGMGTVYWAEQASPRRAVALKILSASLWSQSAERRFEFESQILARLQHPNIAQVYEAGSHRLEIGATTQFFAMEYVPNARTITQYAEEQQLDTRQRLELFLQVCDAVQYGHRKGIIHRDLKPANILVGGDGRVKVIDFGVARCIDSDVALTTMHTETGQLIGTLAYMSPEQCDADPLGLDVRSDVYSLGVVLYELICGRLPYEVSNTNVYAATQAIKLTPPARPRVLVRGVSDPHRRSSRDLETVMLKAIEKDRIKRYSGASELADDIGRYLRREPIAARPPTAWTRSLRWAIRHPVRVTLIASGGIAAITLLATTLAVYRINLRPDHIEISSDYSTARLVTWNGRPVHKWRGTAAAAVKFATIMTQPEQFGGRRLAIIGFSESSTLFPSRLCAFDIDKDCHEPQWSKTIDVATEAPPSVVAAGKANWGFHPARELIADMFPALPGDELIVVFSHSQAYRALRVYSSNGTLLSQFWQRGSVGRPRWLSKPGLLVLSTGNENEKLNTIKFAPLVVAVRLDADPQNRRDPRESELSIGAAPAWHFYIHPPHTPEYNYSIELTDTGSGEYANDAYSCLRFVFPIDDPLDAYATFELLIDSEGQEVPGTRRIGDTYRCHAELPDPGVFVLSKLSPSQVDWSGKQATTTAPAS